MKSACIALVLVAPIAAAAQDFQTINSKIVRAEHDGRTAIHLVPTANMGEEIMAIAPQSFREGTIDVDVAGAPLPDAPPDARGFIGIAFRVRPNAAAFECFYVRPTNGRADDQLRRNHSTQYISYPDYPWERLRKENPGVYESYADLESGRWTHLHVVVEGQKARLYVNGAPQPALIVNDLKLGTDGGAVAFWTTATTDAWFSGLKVTSR